MKNIIENDTQRQQDDVMNDSIEAMQHYDGEQSALPAGLLDEQGNFSPEWYRNYESLNAEAKSLAKFKTPEALAKSYAQLERMKRYPGKDESDKMISFRRLAGLPDDASEYALTRPEGVSDDHWNQPLAEQIAAVAYEYGVPPEAMDALSETFFKAQSGELTRIEQQRQQDIIAAEQALQDEWGTQYERGVHQAMTTVEKLSERANVDPAMLLNDPSIALNPGFLRVMREAAMLMEEAPLRGEKTMAPSASQEARRIESDPSHPLHEAYMNHNHVNHKYANEMYDQLAFGK